MAVTSACQEVVSTVGEQHSEEDGWIIISVKQDKKERRRYQLFAGSEEPLLSVHEDILIKFSLMKGRLLSESELEEIRMEDERYRAYALAVYYLGSKPRTRKQIEQYLLRKQFEEMNIRYALDRLESEHIVDDEQYALQFAAQRLKSGLKGRHWIKQELQQHGISQELAGEVLRTLNGEAELASATAAAGKKWRSLKGTPKERKQKLIVFLLRRGFPSDIAREAVKSVDSDEDEDAFDMDEEY
jgi:regulatory protein